MSADACESSQELASVIRALLGAHEPHICAHSAHGWLTSAMERGGWLRFLTVSQMLMSTHSRKSILVTFINYMTIKKRQVTCCPNPPMLRPSKVLGPPQAAGRPHTYFFDPCPVVLLSSHPLFLPNYFTAYAWPLPFPPICASLGPKWIQFGRPTHCTLD